MLTHIKAFESYSDISIEDDENFYDVIGTNLYNLLNDQIEFLSNNYKRYINIHALKKILKNKNILTTDIVNILKRDLKHRISRLNKKKLTTHDVFNELVSYLYFIHFIIIALRIDMNKLLELDSSIIGITNKKILYNIFNLKNISDLDKNIKKYVNTLLYSKSSKNSIENASKIKKTILNFLNTRYNIWINFFESEKYKEYQIEKLKPAKKDEQQVESENSIQKIEQTQDKTNIKKSTTNIDNNLTNITTDTVTNTATTAASTITTNFKDKFKQKHGVGAGENKMKPWVLKMFAHAEKEYGKPFIITSGYRSKAYQEELRRRPGIKAAKHSPHVEGAAADISLNGVNKRKLIKALKNAGFNRFGIGKSFIHVDAADKINPNIWVPYARWSYKY